MALIIIIILFIICTIVGFNGLPLMFVFSTLFILIIIGSLFTNSNKQLGNKVIQDDNMADEDKTLEEHFMFKEFTDHFK